MSLAETDPFKANTTAPSSSDGIRFRLDFLLATNFAVEMPPFNNTTIKRRHRRPTRNVKVRPQPRTATALAATKQQTSRNDFDFPAAATTDKSLKALSPITRRMQAQARLQAYEQYGQRSDRESLRRLEALTKANRRKEALLDRISLNTLERATAGPSIGTYTPRTVSTADLERFATLNSDLNSSRTAGSEADVESNVDSFVFVDSQPTLESDDVFATGARFIGSPQMQFKIPTLSFGVDSAENTASSGRPLQGIEEESTGSISNCNNLGGSLPPNYGSPDLKKKGLMLERLQDLENEPTGAAVTQSWLEEQISQAMANNVFVPYPHANETNESTSEELNLMVEDEESDILEEDEGYKGDAESEDGGNSFVFVGNEEGEEDWFEVSTEKMVKSTI